MDFLKNLGSKIINTGKKIGSTISGAFSQAVDNAKGLAASTYFAGQAAKPSNSPAQSFTAGPGITYSPVPNSAYESLNVKKAQELLASPTKGSITAANAPAISSPVNWNNISAPESAPQMTPYNPYTPVDYSTVPTSRPSVRTSSRAVGEQYTNYQGKLITPKVGFSGLSGEGGDAMSFSSLSSGFGSNSFANTTPATGISGISGFGGFGASNSLGTTGVPQSGIAGVQQTDEEKKATEERKKNQKAVGGLLSQTSALAQQLGIQPQQTSPFWPSGPRADITIPGANTPLNVASTGPVVNMGNIETAKENIAKTLGTSEANLDNDLNNLNTQIVSNFEKAYQEIDAQNQTPENPVIDTPEQEAYVQESGDPYGARALMDAWREENTNLKQLQGTRIDLYKNIQALNAAYSPIIDDIKNNPNLPKALQARRLEEVQKKQKLVLESFTNQLELINQSIDDQNETVNRTFNIAKFAVDQEEKERDNNLAKLKLFVDSGAIGAFTDADIKRYSNLTGTSTESLKSMRASAKNPNQKIITETDASGNVRGIDQNTGKVIWTLAGAGKPTVQPTGTEAQGKLGEFANRLEQSIPIIKNLAPTIQSYDPVKLQAYMTAQDWAPILTSKFVPENVKSYLQASRSLINAILRRESGAVISSEEFANARLQYLPMPGDSNDMVKQKLQNAQINQDNYKKNAGVAYVPFIQTAPVASPTTSTGTTYQSGSGKSYILPY